MSKPPFSISRVKRCMVEFRDVQAGKISKYFSFQIMEIDTVPFVF